MIKREQAAHIAQLVRTMRPAWDELTIINLLAQHQQSPLDTITKAALNAAQNPKAETPRAINWPEHWPTSAITPTGINDDPDKPGQCHNPDHGSNPNNCSQCRSELIAPRDPHPCPQPLHRYWAHNCPDCRHAKET